MAADAAALLDALAARGWSLGTAESLTGGLLAATVVEVPGASRVFAGSVVAYDPAVKISLLGVDQSVIERVGTVDEQVATQMATGACRALGVDVAVATTGVAGPGPSEGHPAGTVWLACAWPEGVSTRRLALTGERSEVRAAAVAAALTLVAETIGCTSTGGGPDLSQGLT